MAFKSFERYILVDGEYQLMSERTSAKDVIFNDGTNLEDTFPFVIEIDDANKTINFIDR